MDLRTSANAHSSLPGVRTACSRDAGWSSLLLRAYREPRVAREFTTKATPDHLIVLVTAGTCEIEARGPHGRWQSARYRAGDVGMTAPGRESTLRWRGRTAHDTLQLHLPAATLSRARDELAEWAPSVVEMPNRLTYADPTIASLMRALSEQARSGAPDLYADTAAHLLAVHLLVRHAGFSERRDVPREDARLRRVDAFLRENLGSEITLGAMAAQAKTSRFHLLRLFKDAYGETPYRRLTRLRMEEAKNHLVRSRTSITEIASLCGYANSAHFATAFRRIVGISPTAYRRAAR